MHAAGDKARVARLEPAAAAVLEFELDPALQCVDELALADMIMPAGRSGHAGQRRRHLRPHPSVASRGDAEVAVFEKVAAPGTNSGVFALVTASFIAGCAAALSFLSAVSTVICNLLPIKVARS